MPKRLKWKFSGHSVSTIEEAGFKGLKNGRLLRAASENFDLLITVDKNIEYQQNKDDLPMAVLILSVYSNRYESIVPLIPVALERLSTIDKNEIVKIEA